MMNHPLPRLLVTLDGAMLKEVPLAKERTTIGRRPYNDIVINHLAVSGEHAVFTRSPEGSVEVEDVGSTNGTSVNGQPVKRQALRVGDTVEIGKYQLRLLAQGEVPPPAAPAPTPAAPTPVATPAAAASAPGDSPATPAPGAAIRIVSGTAAGRQAALTKVVTTLGKPGVAVASITRRPHGFVLAHVEGEQVPLLNGAPVGAGAQPLKGGDRIVLAGTEMEFVQG